MIKLSDLMGKSVINIYDGNIEGIIKNAYFDQKFTKLKWLILFDDLDEISTDKALDINKIYSINDSIMVKNAGQVEQVKSIEAKLSKLNPINQFVFDTAGKRLGKIAEINLDDEFKVLSFVLDSGSEIKVEDYISSNNVFIVQNESSKILAYKFKQKSKINQNNITNEPVYILRSENEIIKRKIQALMEENNSNSQNKAPNLNIRKADTQLPNRITSDVAFLLGRKITKNIYSPSNEIIAKKNSIVNATNIEVAKKYGKIKELTTFSIIQN